MHDWSGVNGYCWLCIIFMVGRCLCLDNCYRMIVFELCKFVLVYTDNNKI